MNVLFGVPVGEYGDPDGQRMAPHMPAIRQQGKRVEPQSADDLNDHCRERDNEDDKRASSGHRTRVSKVVVVRPFIEIVTMHSFEYTASKKNGATQRR